MDLELLLAQLDALINKAKSENRNFTPEEDKEADKLQGQIAGAKKVLDLAASQSAARVIAAPTVPATASASGAPALQAGQKPGGHVTVTTDEADKQQFQTFGHQLLAIRQAGVDKVVDPRLLTVNKRAAAEGNVTSDPKAGGYLIEQTFSKEIDKATWEVGEITKRIPVGQMNSPVFTTNYLKNLDRTVAGGTTGGIQVFTTKEAETYQRSNLSFEQMSYTAHKFTALYWETDEFGLDAVAVGTLFRQELPTAFADKYEYQFFNGKNVGEWEGILNAPGTFQVPKKGGQSNGTVVVENINTMFAHLPVASRKDAIWVCSVELESKLPDLLVGNMPVYMSPGHGLAEPTLGRLKGLPVLPHAHAKAFGQRGDLMLIVPKFFRIMQRTGLDVQMSIHVGFESGQVVWRADQRIAGRPSIPEVMKNADGWDLSNFLVLEKRAA